MPGFMRARLDVDAAMPWVNAQTRLYHHLKIRCDRPPNAKAGPTGYTTANHAAPCTSVVLSVLRGENRAFQPRERHREAPVVPASLTPPPQIGDRPRRGATIQRPLPVYGSYFHHGGARSKAPVADRATQRAHHLFHGLIYSIATAICDETDKVRYFTTKARSSRRSVAIASSIRPLRELRAFVVRYPVPIYQRNHGLCRTNGIPARSTVDSRDSRHDPARACKIHTSRIIRIGQLLSVAE